MGRRKPTKPERDFVAIADEFARDALADTEGQRHGKWVRLACARYIRDRKRATEQGTPFTFEPEEAERVCKFIEELPHVEGRWSTPTIELHKSHVFFLVNVFGFRNHDGTRRFTTALLAVARKNAKSTLAAGILLYCLCYEEEPGPQLITAATTGDQARVIFKIAHRMVELTADLRQAFELEAFANAVVNYQVGGNLRPINAHASTQDGLNPSHVALDEIHAHKTHDLLNVLQSAAGARLNPLWLYTTTEGYETPGPWPEMRHFAHQILNGIVEADHFFALIFALDDQVGEPGQPNYKPGDEDFDESKWAKANPLMEVNPILEREIRKAAIDAKQMPGRHAEFKIKRLNRQAAGARTWVDLERWKRCGGAVDLEAMKGVKDCWAGLDLASTRDLTSFRLLWRIGDTFYTWGMRWVPKDAVQQRTERGTVRYDAWVRSGFITQTEGAVTDYEVVERDVVAICKRFQPKEIAFDRWNATDIVNRLLVGGLPMVEFIQGPKSYHPAMQLLERTYISGNLAHGSDPVLAWCASNLVPRRDVNLNLAPDRLKSADKIDDMTALLMAFGRAATQPEPKPTYQLMMVGK